MTRRSHSLPVALKLDGRLCLVVGSGVAARQRVENLLACGARVRFVSPESTDRDAAAALDDAVEFTERDYVAADLEECWLAVYTGADPETARRIAADADARRALFCAVDQPEHNSFSHVAIARASSLFVAVGSEGATPSLTRRLREEIQRILDESNIGDFVERLAALRTRLPKGSRAKTMNEAVSDVRITGTIELPSELPDSDDTRGAKP